MITSLFCFVVIVAVVVVFSLFVYIVEFFLVVAVVVVVVLLLLCYCCCLFASMFMSYALLKFELSLRLVLGTECLFLSFLFFVMFIVLNFNAKSFTFSCTVYSFFQL